MRHKGWLCKLDRDGGHDWSKGFKRKFVVCGDGALAYADGPSHFGPKTIDLHSVESLCRSQCLNAPVTLTPSASFPHPSPSLANTLLPSTSPVPTVLTHALLHLTAAATVALAIFRSAPSISW